MRKRIITFLFAVMIAGIPCTAKRVQAQPSNVLFTDVPVKQMEEFSKSQVTDSGICNDGLSWELTLDGTLTIRGNGPMGSALDKQNTVISPWKNYCKQIKKVVLENGVTSVGNYAFSSQGDVVYSNLTSVTLPETVTILNGHAFRGCSSLKKIILNEGLETIEMGALSGTGLRELTIPSTVTNIDIMNQTIVMGVPFCGENLANINVKKGNMAFSSSNGVLYNKAKTTLICFPCGKGEKQFTVPSSVSYIAGGAFCKCSRLEKVVLSKGVKSIGSFTFFNSKSLREVVLKSNKMSGGYGLFENCKNVKVTVLNRKCNMDEWILDDGVTICGYPGSTAQTFARKGGFKFVTLKGEEQKCPHSNVTVSKKKATVSKNGSIAKVCKKCGKTLSKTSVYYPKSVALSVKQYIYDGKIKRPSVTVKGSNGKKIKPSNYTVSYLGGCKNVGKYTVKITFKGNYSGTITTNFVIRAKDVS